MPAQVVKARLHHGTKSLDLTIPVKIVNGMNIKEGDVFTVQMGKNIEGKIEIIYTRIFNGIIEDSYKPTHKQSS